MKTAKTKKIRIAIVEDQHFYNKIIEEQISEICESKKSTNFKVEITSVDDVNDLQETSTNSFQAIIFDNYYNNNRQAAGYNVQEIMDKVQAKNKNCFFITISGYREMNISAYLFKDGELTFTYSKQTAVKNESHEEMCSIPALYKLMERLIDNALEELNKASHRIAA